MPVQVLRVLVILLLPSVAPSNLCAVSMFSVVVVGQVKPAMLSVY